MAAPSPAHLAPSADGADEAKHAYKVFDNKLFQQQYAFQQQPQAMHAPVLQAPAEPQLQVSAPTQQPTCSYGMSDDIARELQRALEHRHNMLKTYKHLTEGLWEQLQQVLNTSKKLPAQSSTACSALMMIQAVATALKQATCSLHSAALSIVFHATVKQYCCTAALAAMVEYR
jgi:hypothetical protein